MGQFEKYITGDSGEREPDVLLPPPANPMSPPGDTLQTIDDAARATANSASFDMADRLAGAMPGSSVEREFKLSDEARKRSPYASLTGDVLGAAALPAVGGPRLAATLATKLPNLPGWVARGIGYGTEGAVIGGAQGAGGTRTGKWEDYVTNAGKGGGMGAVLGFGGGALFAPGGGVRSTAATPTTAELYQEKTGNYRNLNLMPQMYEPSALATRADQVESTLRNPPNRYRPDAMPTALAAISEMRAPPTTAHLGSGAILAPGDLEAIRQGINSNVTAVPSDLASSGVVKRSLNDFVLNPPPGAVLPGMAAQAAQAQAMAERARGNYGGYKRGQAFDALIHNAQNAAASAHSGLNFENTMRQHVRSFVRQDKHGDSPASRAGYNQTEIDALDKYAQGNASANVQRWVSNVLGGGGGMAVPVVGGITSQYFRDNPLEGGIAGLAAPAIGFGTRVVGNRRAGRDVQALSDMTRQRTPLYQERAAGAPMVPPPGGGNTTAVRNALTEEIMRQQQQERE
jgi:hypothetical protein